MFTGIVERMGRLARYTEIPGGANLTFDADGFSGELALGESVCVSGVCLTVVARTEKSFDLQAIRETLARTNLGSLAIGDAVNLERSLRPSDRIGGHFVTGHIDATARVAEVRDSGAEWLLRVELPPSIASHFVEKGSVAINGVSLTVAGVSEQDFIVYLIPFTREQTNLGALAAAATVNIESDLIGKYAARILGEHARAMPGSGAARVYPEGSLR
ncbi:MAG: riboflavin synthase [bacterium]